MLINHSTKRHKGFKFSPEEKKQVDDIKLLAQSYCAEAVHVIAEIMANERNMAGVRLAAANSLLDRGYGKPKQEIDATVTSPPKVDLKVVYTDTNGKQTVTKELSVSASDPNYELFSLFDISSDEYSAESIIEGELVELEHYRKPKLEVVSNEPEKSEASYSDESYDTTE